MNLNKITMVFILSLLFISCNEPRPVYFEADQTQGLEQEKNIFGCSVPGKISLDIQTANNVKVKIITSTRRNLRERVESTTEDLERFIDECHCEIIELKTIYHNGYLVSVEVYYTK